MKKMLVLMMFSLTFIVSFAQDASDNALVIRGSKKISRSMTPQQVIDSLKKRFPDAQSIEYYRTPAAGVRDGWHITTDDNLDINSPVDRYTLSFKRKDFQYYGLFNPDGRLIMSKLQDYQAHLPDAVKASLKKLAGADYKDYTILTKKYFRTRNYSSVNETYEVTAVKHMDPKQIKTITLDATGKVLKVW